MSSRDLLISKLPFMLGLQMPVAATRFFCGCQRFEIRSLCLHGRSFTDWDISVTLLISLFFNFSIYLFLFCVFDYLPTCMCMHSMCAVSTAARRGSLELELQAVINCVGAGNQSLVLCKRTRTLRNSAISVAPISFLSEKKGPQIYCFISFYLAFFVKLWQWRYFFKSRSTDTQFSI